MAYKSAPIKLMERKHRRVICAPISSRVAPVARPNVVSFVDCQFLIHQIMLHIQMDASYMLYLMNQLNMIGHNLVCEFKRAPMWSLL